MPRRRKEDMDRDVFDGKVHKPQQRNAANARERSRMRILSKAFSRLKTTLPWVPPDTKLSKLDTLRLASSYIAHLKQILDHEESMHANGFIHPLNLTWPFTFNGRSFGSAYSSPTNDSNSSGNASGSNNNQAESSRCCGAQEHRESCCKMTETMSRTNPSMSSDDVDINTKDGHRRHGNNDNNNKYGVVPIYDESSCSNSSCEEDGGCLYTNCSSLSHIVNSH